MKRDGKYYLNRKIRLNAPHNLINDERVNPNMISRLLDGDNTLEARNIETGDVYNIYNISSSIMSGKSKVHDTMVKELGFKSIMSYILLKPSAIHPDYNIPFIANKKYSLLEVNKMLENKVTNSGPKYFDWVEDVIHNYFIDSNGRYHKIFDIYIDLETGHNFILYKCLYGKYEYRVEYYSGFLNRFPDCAPFSSHAYATDVYTTSPNRIERHKQEGLYNKVKEVVNPKNNLYKAYENMRKAKGKLFSYGNPKARSYGELDTQINVYNQIIKDIKHQINIIKEGQNLMDDGLIELINQRREARREMFKHPQCSEEYNKYDKISQELRDRINNYKPKEV